MLCAILQGPLFPRVRAPPFNAEQEKQLVNRLLQLAKQTQLLLHEGAVAAQHLQSYLVNLACEDAGCAVVQEVMLLVLRQQLDSAATAAAAASKPAAMPSHGSGLRQVGQVRQPNLCCIDCSYVCALLAQRM
jgi:hypothetical protein